jgi:protein O-mannosyl-transferase
MSRKKRKLQEAVRPQEASTSLQMRNVVMGFTIMAYIFVLYLPAVGHRFLSFDDPSYITMNPPVLSGLSREGFGWAFFQSHSANWHPLTWISHMMDCELFGLNPAGHHLTNILLHALNAVLVFFVLSKMTGSFWRSAVVALLFASHPQRVESVAWISERKDVLSGFFFMLTLLAYTAYVQRKKTSDQQIWATSFKDPFYLLTIGLFSLGLMSKPMLVTLPFVLLLIDYWPLKRVSMESPGWTQRLFPLVVEKWPMFLLSIVSCAITYLVQSKEGATRMFANLELWPRLQNIAVSYVRYIGKTLWPENLSIFYPFPPEWWPPAVVGGAVACLSVVTVLVWWFSRRLPYAPVGWFWYVGMLVPVIGLLQVGEQSMADRYTYLPVLGLLLLLVWGLADVGKTLGLHPRWGLAALLPIGAFSFATTAYLRHWYDGESIFRHAVAVTPAYYNTRLCLGIALLEKKKLNEALVELDTALEMNPRDSLIHYNRGATLEGLGRLPEALASYRKSLEISPGYLLAYLSIARVALLAGEPGQAESALRSSLQLVPEDVQTRLLLASVLKVSGKPEESMAELRTILEYRPDLAEAHHDLAICLSETAHPQEGLNHFREAARLEPNNENYRYNLEKALEATGEQIHNPPKQP